MGNANISGPPPNVKAPSSNQCSDKTLADIDPDWGIKRIRKQDPFIYE